MSGFRLWGKVTQTSMVETIWCVDYLQDSWASDKYKSSSDDDITLTVYGQAADVLYQKSDPTGFL